VYRLHPKKNPIAISNVVNEISNLTILTLVLILLSLGGICSFAFQPGSMRSLWNRRGILVMNHHAFLKQNIHL
jgi:hypothetical protein